MASVPEILAASGAASAAPRGEAGSLEPWRNVVPEGERPEGQVFVLSACRCDCWYCPDCCRSKGYRLRQELIGVVKTFAATMMLTLTVDPEIFASPKAAYLYLRKKRGIARLVRSLHKAGYLHSPRYFCVVEFQRETEHAHYHLLIDASYVPKSAIDSAWSKLRPRSAGPVAVNRPAFGVTRFSKRDFESPEHAALYATKYLIKTPDYGWPPWVTSMGSEKRVPRYQASKGLWGRPAKPKPQGTPKKRQTKARSYSERIEDCGTSSNLFAETEMVDAATGECRAALEWQARLDAGADVLASIPGAIARGRRAVMLLGVSAVCVRAELESALGREVRVLFGSRRGGLLP